MNRLFKVLYVNLIGMFDINKIRIARQSGVKSNLEKRSIILALMAIFYGFIIYKTFTSIKIENIYLILSIGFVVSSLLCLFLDLFIIEAVVFKSDDNDILFSFPLSKYQMLFSKLFNVYLKNLFLVVIIMFSVMVAFLHFVGNVNENFIIMYILSCMFIPIIPLVLATILSFFNSYLKLKFNNNLFFKIGKVVCFFIICYLFYISFRDVRGESLNSILELMFKKINFIYPMSFFFYRMIINENSLFFVLMILIPIFIIYIYSLYISNNYLQMCSMLKGVKKRKEFVYKRTLNLRQIFGIVRKEMLNLIGNKFYLFNSYGGLVLLSLSLMLILYFFDISSLEKIDHFKDYFSLYCPTILATFVTLSCSTVSAISLEKNNLQILRTLPIRFSKVLFGKWLVNVLIGFVLVLINAFTVYYYFDVKIDVMILNILVPLVSVMFVSLTGLVFDYRFICKNESNDNIIIKQRLITLIPTFISCVIGIGPFFLTAMSKYIFVLGSYILLMILLMIFEIGYLIINNKKLLKNLFI